MTFSIAAFDGDASPPEWGVAVASKFLAVGNAVPWARAGVGAIATQALANLAYGPDGLEKLATGMPADQVMRLLIVADDQREHRQLGVIDATGEAAIYTGGKCLQWSGGRTGDGYCAQGNILTGPEVVADMCDAFENTASDLAARLMAALYAGDRAGGDRRGRQSAAILVVREGGGYGGGTDTAVDLRVDDHSDPVPELARLLDINRLLFPHPNDLDFIPIDVTVARNLRDWLAALGYGVPGGEGYDAGLRKTLYEYVGTENLEERWTDEATIDRKVLDYLREHSERGSTD